MTLNLSINDHNSESNKIDDEGLKILAEADFSNLEFCVLCKYDFIKPTTTLPMQASIIFSMASGLNSNIYA